MVSGGENSNVRATSFRDAILNGSLDDVLDFFPKELTRQEILKIVKMLKQGIIAEMVAEKIQDIYSGWFDEDTITEGSSGIPLQNTATVTSQDRDRLGDQLEAIKNIIDDRFEAEMHGDRIVVKLKGESPYNTSDMPTAYDYGDHFAGLLEYMIREGMTVQPLPEVKIRRDLAEAENFFGKTAYYNPTDKEVVLYAAGRHPKDVTRSFAHEMVHHMQNLEGRLGNRGTTDTTADKELAALEAKSDQEENLNELEDKLVSDEAAASEERSEKLEEELAVTDAIQEEQLQQEQGQSKIESQAERVGLRGDQSQLRVESALAAAGQSSLQMLSSATGTQSLAMSQQEQMQQMIGNTESAFFGAAADSLTGMGGFSSFGVTDGLNEGNQLTQSTLEDSASGNISQLLQSDLLLGRMDPPAEKPAREPVESDISGDESATIEAIATVPGFSQYTVTRPQVQPEFYTSTSPYGRALPDNNLRMYQMSNDAVWEKLRGDQYGR
jgi:hypothetical protein